MKKLWLLFLLMAGCEGCVVIQPYTAILPLNMPQAGMSGQTLCDLNGVPTVVVSHLLLGNDMELNAVLVHERVHVRQVQRHGNCNAFMFAYTNSVQFRIEVEAEAYCAELEYRVNHGGLERGYGINRIVETLTTSPRYKLGEEVDSSAVAKLVKGLSGCRPDQGGLGSLSER